MIRRIIVLILICSWIYCSNGDRAPLARFDGGIVTQQEYIEHYLASTRYKPKQYPTEANLKEIVRRRAIDKMVIQEAIERQLDQDSTYKRKALMNENRLIFYRYMRTTIIDSIITDSLIMKFYREFSPQYRMRYILRPVVETSTEAFARMQHDTIRYVYRLLQQGHSFEEMAQKYSQDVTSNRKGGDLGFVIRESMGDAVLRSVMDTLKDFHYSKPFRGFAGWYIMYKGEQRDVPVPAFEKVRQRIWNTLFHTRQHLVRMAVDKRFEQMAKKHHYRVDQALVRQLLSKAGWNEAMPAYAIIDFSFLKPADFERTVATFDSGFITLGEIFANIKKAPDTKEDFEKKLISIAQQQVLAYHARELGVDKDDALQKQIEQMKQDLLRSKMYRMLVTDRVKAKTDSLKATQNVSSGELQKFMTQTEKQIKTNFEKYLLKKYHFVWVESNFAGALAEASRRKDEQNAKQERSPERS